MPRLITTLDTYFKPTVADSKTIPAEDMVRVPARREFAIRSYRQEAGHVIFSIHPDDMDLKSMHPSGKNTWCVWEGSIADPEGFSVDNKPKDIPPPAAGSDLGVPFSLPGYTQTFYSNDPVTAKSPNITWAELLHFSGKHYRPPANSVVVNNLMQIANLAQGLRDRFGKPITIRSGYRDPVTNKRVGGASQSQHVQGNAIDLAIPGHRPIDLYNALNSSWKGGLAYSNSMDFLHIDRRQDGNARWVYPGG